MSSKLRARTAGEAARSTRQRDTSQSLQPAGSWKPKASHVPTGAGRTRPPGSPGSASAAPAGAAGRTPAAALAHTVGPSARANAPPTTHRSTGRKCCKRSVTCAAAQVAPGAAGRRSPAAGLHTPAAGTAAGGSLRGAGNWLASQRGTCGAASDSAHTPLHTATSSGASATQNPREADQRTDCSSRAHAHNRHMARKPPDRATISCSKLNRCCSALPDTPVSSSSALEAAHGVSAQAHPAAGSPASFLFLAVPPVYVWAVKKLQRCSGVLFALEASLGSC